MRKSDGKRRRPRLGKASARLLLKLGGIDLLDVKAELRLRCATVVGKWAHSATRYGRLLGNVLLDPSQAPTYVMPGTVHTGSELPTSLWQGGAVLCGHVQAHLHNEVRSGSPTRLQKGNVGIYPRGRDHQASPTMAASANKP